MQHLAEFNIGTLKYDWDDPRVADFANNLDRVFAVAERSPGYVWHLPGPEMEAAQLDAGSPLGGDPRTASTLSVWESLADLRHFTFHTLHKQFYARRAEWYGPQSAWGGHRLVMWWVAPGHRPSITEAAERLEGLAHHGDTDDHFGWDYARAQWEDGT